VLRAVIQAIRGWERSARSLPPFLRIVSCRDGLIPHAATNICRCCYEPEAPYAGAVCPACLYVRTISDLDAELILTAYECEMSEP
jgi:hypothetical protein